jgi:hypothetical protein
MGGPMLTNRGMTLAFIRKGVYKPTGPDNNLRLFVTVACGEATRRRGT